LDFCETNCRVIPVLLSGMRQDALEDPRHAAGRSDRLFKFILEGTLQIKRLALFALVAGLLAVPSSMLAHHGTANYDMTTVTTLKGTVTDFQFINPHTLILFDVKNDQGVVEHWQAEATSPNHLVRAGWTKDIVKSGDAITISGFRAKNGSNVLRFQKMALANGQEIKEGGSDN